MTTVWDVNFDYNKPSSTFLFCDNTAATTSMTGEDKEQMQEGDHETRDVATGIATKTRDKGKGRMQEPDQDIPDVAMADGSNMDNDDESTDGLDDLTALDNTLATDPDFGEDGDNVIDETPYSDGLDDLAALSTRIDEDPFFGDSLEEPPAAERKMKDAGDMIATRYRNILRNRPKTKETVKEFCESVQDVLRKWAAFKRNGVISQESQENFVAMARFAVFLPYDDEESHKESDADVVRREVGEVTARTIEEERWVKRTRQGRAEGHTIEVFSESRAKRSLDAAEAGMRWVRDEMQDWLDQIEYGEEVAAFAASGIEYEVNTTGGFTAINKPARKRKNISTPTSTGPAPKRQKKTSKKSEIDCNSAPDSALPPPKGGNNLGRLTDGGWKGGNKAPNPLKTLTPMPPNVDTPIDFSDMDIVPKTSFPKAKSTPTAESSTSGHTPDTGSKPSKSKPKSATPADSSTPDQQPLGRKVRPTKWSAKEDLCLLKAKATADQPGSCWKTKGSTEMRVKQHNAFLTTQNFKDIDGKPLTRSWASIEQHEKKLKSEGKTIADLERKIRDAEAGITAVTSGTDGTAGVKQGQEVERQVDVDKYETEDAAGARNGTAGGKEGEDKSDEEEDAVGEDDGMKNTGNAEAADVEKSTEGGDVTME